MIDRTPDQIIQNHLSQLSETFDAIQIIAKTHAEEGGQIFVGRRGGKITLKISDKFWCRVDRSHGPDSCWVFCGHTSGGGHGHVRIGTGKKGTLIGAHRLAWILINGAIPQGLCVCHRCDNPPCCNPKHLFLATALENFDDMRQKGRARGGSLVGTTNKNSKLTDEQVAEIRTAYQNGTLQRELAKQYGVAQTSISYIVSQGGWKHIK